MDRSPGGAPFPVIQTGAERRKEGARQPRSGRTVGRCAQMPSEGTSALSPAKPLPSGAPKGRAEQAATAPVARLLPGWSLSPAPKAGSACIPARGLGAHAPSGGVAHALANQRAGRVFIQPRSPPSGRELTPRSAEMRPVRSGPRPKDQGKNQHTAWNFAPSWAANVSASPRHSLFSLITEWQRIQSSPGAAHTHTRTCTYTHEICKCNAESMQKSRANRILENLAFHLFKLEMLPFSKLQK